MRSGISRWENSSQNEQPNTTDKRQLSHRQTCSDRHQFLKRTFLLRLISLLLGGPLYKRQHHPTRPWHHLHHVPNTRTTSRAEIRRTKWPRSITQRKSHAQQIRQEPRGAQIRLRCFPQRPRTAACSLRARSPLLANLSLRGQYRRPSPVC